MSYSSSLIIEEVATESTPAGRTLDLTGPGLPFMGAEWAMKNQVITTWYPGNGDEATQQVLGPQELPSRWNGDWRRTMLGKQPCLFTDDSGNTITIVDPQGLRDALELLARAGQRLRVTWNVASILGLSDQTGRLVREGRITELKFKHTRVQDIEWEAEFTWMSRGGNVPKITSTRGNTVASNSGKFQDKLNQLLNANFIASIQKFKVASLTIGQLEAFAALPSKLANSLARSVQQISSSVGDVVNLAKTIATQPVQVANRAVDLAHNTVSQVNGFYDTLSSIPYESQTTKVKVADFLRAAKAAGKTSDLALDTSRSGQEYALQLQSQIQAANQGRVNPTRLGNPNFVQQVYITKFGDTPQRVSQRFYNTPDHAVDILRSNKLSWYTVTFPIGKILIIPSLADATTTIGV